MKQSSVLVMLVSCIAAVFGSTAHAQRLSLDGDWQVVFDTHNKGRAAGWQKNAVFEALSDAQVISVPSAWELIKQDYEGVAFYRRSFDVPETWEGKVVRLHFGAVNYLAEVWLNDEVVGWHEGGFTPFAFRVDEMLKPGQRNVLSLRVVGPIILSDKHIDGVGPLETPQWRGGITGGIWQSVHLEASGEIYVENVFIEPRIQNRAVTLHVSMDHTGIKPTYAGIEIDIREDKASAPVAQLRRVRTLRPGKNKRTWTVPLAQAKLWSPDKPVLYRATLRISVDAQVSDTWTERFGMRELTIKDKDFYLNGQRIYIKACFFEGLYPNGIASPDSEAMARQEIQLAKDAGFNMIRPWRRPPVPSWLDLADEMGVLVVGSPALECMRLPLSTPYLPSRVENEVREAVMRDRNRACVVQWELFNELHRPVLKQMMRPMAMLTRNLDPTRLILDESGGWAFGANMYLPGEYQPTKFNDIHNYPGPFITGWQYDAYLAIGMTDQEKRAFGFRGNTPGRNVVPGLMSFVSELGYGSLPNLVDSNKRFADQGNPFTPAYRYHKRLAQEQQRMLAESGFSDLYPDMEQFYLDQQAIHGAANKRMIEAVRSNPDVDGYCIHALCAGDWILGAGLIDLWRKPKSYAYEGTKAANQPRILSIRVKPRNVYAERGARLEVTGINELTALDASLQIEIVSKRGDVVFKQEINTLWASGVSRLFRQQLNTRALRGQYTVKTRMVSKAGVLLSENAHAFDVFANADLERPKAQVAVLDLTGTLKKFFKGGGIAFIEFDEATPLSMPVFVTSTQTKNKAQEGRFAALLTFVKRGGTVVYAAGTKKSFQRSASNQVKTATFPFDAQVEAAQGLWTCIPHLVRDHPIFKGLPVNTMMRDVYQNVWARQTLKGLGGQAVVASIGFDWFSHDHKMHYSGPGASWWGSDLAVVPFGQGRCVVSQLRIVENLGKDPVADKILCNLIEFAMHQ
jgi:beta-galactosidase